MKVTDARTGRKAPHAFHAFSTRLGAILDNSRVTAMAGEWRNQAHVVRRWTVAKAQRCGIKGIIRDESVSSRLDWIKRRETMLHKVVLSVLAFVVVCGLLLIPVAPALAYGGQAGTAVSAVDTGGLNWVPKPLKPNSYPPPPIYRPVPGGFRTVDCPFLI